MVFNDFNRFWTTVQRVSWIFIDFKRQYNDFHKFSREKTQFWTMVQRFSSILNDFERPYNDVHRFSQRFSFFLFVRFQISRTRSCDRFFKTRFLDIAADPPDLPEVERELQLATYCPRNGGKDDGESWEDSPNDMENSPGRGKGRVRSRALSFDISPFHFFELFSKLLQSKPTQSAIFEQFFDFYNLRFLVIRP